MIRFVASGSAPVFALTGRADHGRAVWRLCETILVTIAIADEPKSTAGYAMIPAGFETDGASIPWFARAWLDPWSRIGLAAVLHDYLLTAPGLGKWEADLIFLHALRSQGVPAFLATLLYFAVRLRRRRHGETPIA